MLLRLIADGEHLLRLIEQRGFLTNTEGISEADLKATVQNLRGNYRDWHEPRPAAQKAQILAEVFNGANPLIEAIQAARYDLERCARHERAVRQGG